MNHILEYIHNYTSNAAYGWWSFTIDLLLCIICLVGLFLFLYRLSKDKIHAYFFGSFVGLLLIAILLDLHFFLIVVLTVFPLAYLYALLRNGLDIRKSGSSSVQGNSQKKYITNQDVKDRVIENLMTAIEDFSSKHIGAIITIEETTALSGLFTNSATYIDAEISIELLETIFFPNTALHDGSVVIRGSKILYAGAFYTPSDKHDIPQHFGTRHRAAIGVSEQSDSFTIVVSEETGYVSTTYHGTISENISLETLRSSLDQHIILEKQAK